MCDCRDVGARLQLRLVNERINKLHDKILSLEEELRSFKDETEKDLQNLFGGLLECDLAIERIWRATGEVKDREW